MKLFKTITLLLFVATVCLIAIPASADSPGTNEDPFGGYPITGTIPDGVGVVARFGLSPLGYALPGGVPSFKSGDGTTPRKAINISGMWAGPSQNYPGLAASESPEPVTLMPIRELPNCATLVIPAGKARWFKLETYRDRRVQIWLDDERSGATTSSGFSVFGAADRYMFGTAPGDGWQINALRDGVPQTANFLEGFVMAIYDPDNLKPLWAFQPPNAAILSVNTDARGLLLSGPDNISIAEATGAGIHGYGNHNSNVPNHLLWYEGHFHGWVFVMVYNQMIWDGTASVCSQRVW
ncbi:MAG: hypothetical protein L0Y55_13535 [Anaerolineales bacterium]|nr:hypothetical protein [Anaerolineales bacterium]